MILELRGRELIVLGAVLSAGLAGTAVALGGRGADEQFLQDQRHPPKLEPADVERVVKTAPDPATGKGRGVAATCTSKGTGPLKNPWSCVVRYPSGKRVRIAVRIKEDGYYAGRYEGGGAVTGCCIDLPGKRREA
jgi:hypothetical protein